MEENNKDNIEIYELGYHILPTFSEEDVAKEVLLLKENIISRGGSVISEGFPELMQLAYEMKKRFETNQKSFAKSYFGWLKFEFPKEKIIDLDSFLKLNKSILRFILVKTVKENTVYTSKIASYKKEVLSNSEHEDVSVPQMSEEEIDKSIEDLVIT